MTACLLLPRGSAAPDSGPGLRVEEPGAGSEHCDPDRRALPGKRKPGAGPAAAGTASVSAAGSTVVDAGLAADTGLVDVAAAGFAEAATVDVESVAADVEAVAVAAAAAETVAEAVAAAAAAAAAESGVAGCAAAVDCVAAADLVVGSSAAVAVVVAGTVSVVAVWRCCPLMAGRVQWAQAPGWASDLGPAGSTGRKRREVRH